MRDIGGTLQRRRSRASLDSVYVEMSRNAAATIGAGALDAAGLTSARRHARKAFWECLIFARPASGDVAPAARYDSIYIGAQMALHFVERRPADLP